MADSKTRDWLLVTAIVLSFLVVPVAILIRPPSLPFLVAFLALPLLVGVILGLVGVYSGLRANKDDQS